MLEKLLSLARVPVVYEQAVGHWKLAGVLRSETVAAYLKHDRISRLDAYSKGIDSVAVAKIPKQLLMFLKVVLYLLFENEILGRYSLDFETVRLEVLENFLVSKFFFLNFFCCLADFVWGFGRTAQLRTSQWLHLSHWSKSPKNVKSSYYFRKFEENQ